VTTAEDLRAEIRRGQQLDRSLAHDLSRPEPSRTAVSEPYAESLERRPVLPSEAERALVRA
jgi:hypothetical protein